MLKEYYPYAYAESVHTIDYEKLYQLGYRGIIFDIDNTLAHHGEDPEKDVEELFPVIHDIGFKTVLLSNNNEARIKSFLKNIDSLYIPEADKPETKNYLKAASMMNTGIDQTIYIGDQVFIDIYGANKCNMASILVKYMRYPNEKKIGIRRHLEKVILWFYRRNKHLYNRLGNIQKEGIHSAME